MTTSHKFFWKVVITGNKRHTVFTPYERKKEMGLDQYLSAKQYTSPAEWRGEEINKKFHELTETFGVKRHLGTLPSATVEFNVGYWRKANAIHQWFVDNCQDGSDDCREYMVSREQLETLLNLCNQVKENKGLASELLPTTSGFFFGSTEYDEYYFDDIDSTIEIINKVLQMEPSWDFFYQSSW